MQLNKTKSKIRRSLGGGGLNTSFLCAFAPLRDKIRANSCLLVVQPSLFPDKPALSRNLFLRNEPNFTSTEINISNCIRDIYNDFQTKPKIGTNPNEPNQSQFQSLRSLRQKNRKYLVKNKKMKSKPNLRQSRRSLGEDGLARRPVGVVLFTKLTTKTIKNMISANKNMKNKANLKAKYLTVTTYSRVVTAF